MGYCSISTPILPYEATVLDVSEHQPRRMPSKAWRELIKKIREVDPLSCPRCGFEMKIISLIHEPDLVERIPCHLEVQKQPPDPPQGRFKAPEEGPVVVENFDDGWPGYEESVFVNHRSSLSLNRGKYPSSSAPQTSLPRTPLRGKRSGSSI